MWSKTFLDDKLWCHVINFDVTTMVNTQAENWLGVFHWNIKWWHITDLQTPEFRRIFVKKALLSENRLIVVRRRSRVLFVMYNDYMYDGTIHRRIRMQPDHCCYCWEQDNASYYRCILLLECMILNLGRLFEPALHIYRDTCLPSPFVFSLHIL